MDITVTLAAMTKDRKPSRALLEALPIYATRRQAAEAAGVDTRTIDRWRAAGLLKSYEVRGVQRRTQVRVKVASAELAALPIWDDEPVGTSV